MQHCDIPLGGDCTQHGADTNPQAAAEEIADVVEVRDSFASDSAS
jgi:hypothetical protein